MLSMTPRGYERQKGMPCKGMGAILSRELPSNCKPALFAEVAKLHKQAAVWAVQTQAYVHVRWRKKHMQMHCCAYFFSFYVFHLFCIFFYNLISKILSEVWAFSEFPSHLFSPFFFHFVSPDWGLTCLQSIQEFFRWFKPSHKY